MLAEKTTKTAVVVVKPFVMSPIAFGVPIPTIEALACPSGAVRPKGGVRADSGGRPFGPRRLGGDERDCGPHLSDRAVSPPRPRRNSPSKTPRPDLR